MTKISRICATALSEAEAAHGADHPLVAELVARVRAELRFEQVEEIAAALGPFFSDDAEGIASDLTMQYHGRGGKMGDSELLAVLVAAGPHPPAVESLVRMFADVVAEHDAYDRGLDYAGYLAERTAQEAA